LTKDYGRFLKKLEKGLERKDNGKIGEVEHI